MLYAMSYRLKPYALARTKPYAMLYINDFILRIMQKIKVLSSKSETLDYFGFQTLIA